MPLVLTVENAGSFADELQPEFLVNDRAITIGRGRQADWQLPDTSRFLSTVHCEISPDNGLYRLTDRSRNGIAVNGEFMPTGQSRVLLGGERLQLGPFTISARLGGSEAPTPDPDRTVILAAPKRPPARPHAEEEQTAFPGSAKPSPAPTPAPQPIVPRPPASSPQPARRGAHASTFVADFAAGAGLDPDWLASRTDAEFARGLGQMVRLMVPALAGLVRSKTQIRSLAGSQASDDGLFDGSDDDILRALLDPPDGSPAEALEKLETALADLSDHDEAFFAALQTALFRLLNALSPTTVEQTTRTGVLRRKSSRNWDAYGALWEEMSDAGPNGMLDMLLRYFKEAYDAKLDR